MTLSIAPRPGPIGVVSASEPQRECFFCPRLAEFRQANKAQYPGWFNAPVPSFGPKDAPAADCRTCAWVERRKPHGAGPFTGDYAGVLLYRNASCLRVRARNIRGARRRRPRSRWLSNHQLGAMRAAGKQADARRSWRRAEVFLPPPSRKCRTFEPFLRWAGSLSTHRCAPFLLNRRSISSATGQPWT